MNITPEILIFLFSQKHTIVHQHLRRPDQTFQGIRLYDPQEKPDKTFLYVISERAFRRLSAEERKQFSLVFIAAEPKASEEENSLAGKKAGGNVSSVGKKKMAEPAASFDYKELSLAVAAGFPTPGSLFYALQQVFHTLLQQENELLLATMNPENAETVFSFGEKWFPWEYSIVDIDMRLLFRTDNLHNVLGEGQVERIPAESIHELILSREFHEAAKKQEVFYQSMSFSNMTAIARNILPDNKYAGRVVMFLPEAIKKAPKGAEDLFEFYTDCVRETLSRSGHFTGRTQNDPLHLLCRNLFQNESVSAHAVSEGLQRSGWQRDNAYSVIVFRFLTDSAWEAQLETTLPYLADELELEWPDSCAINTGREINWVLNLTLSGADVNLDSFHQKVAHFVRDHICMAGASPVFSDFSLLSEAKKSATSALEIGQNKHPHFWYFSFEDYRLDYIKDTLQSSIPSAFLRHPALTELKQFDEKNNTELLGTLKAYLENGRNMTAAADAIFIHRTTFCRRMDHIRKITGLDLGDPDTALLLELSYQLQD